MALADRIDRFFRCAKRVFRGIVDASFFFSMADFPSEGRKVFSPCRVRVQKRNRAVAARYYYWAELYRRREDDVRRLLCDNEFFVEERTISNALADQNDYLAALIRNRVSRRELRRLYPGFDWR